jgi:manganese efflux pump family protein
MVHELLKIAVFVAPLGLDTFALSLALGVGGIERRGRLRASLMFTAFEGAMPVVGFLIGASVGRAIGTVSTYLAAAALVGAGLYMLWPGRNDEREQARVQLLVRAHGIALLGLGLSISIDELAIGFGVGLLRLPLPVLVGIIVIQAFCAAQLGMRLGSRIGGDVGEWVERLAGLLLLVAAIVVLIG